jgi:hypothetical protein
MSSEEVIHDIEGWKEEKYDELKLSHYAGHFSQVTVLS